MAGTATCMVKPVSFNETYFPENPDCGTKGLYLAYVSAVRSLDSGRLNNHQDRTKYLNSKFGYNRSTSEYYETESREVFIRQLLEMMSNEQSNDIKLLRWETNMSTTQLEQTVINKFRSIREVESIYTRVRGDEHLFMVFTTMSKYNDDVMQKLFMLEIEIEDIFTEFNTEFHYIPSLVDKQDVIVKGKYNRLYKRLENG